jgi:hypothetical protein
MDVKDSLVRLHAMVRALLLAVTALIAIGITVFAPACLGRPAEGLATFLGPNVPPPRRPQTHSLALYGRRREFTTGDVEHLQREIEQDLRRKPGLSHDSSERRRPSDAQARRQFRGHMSAGRRTCF